MGGLPLRRSRIPGYEADTIDFLDLLLSLTIVYTSVLIEQTMSRRKKDARFSNRTYQYMLTVSINERRKGQNSRFTKVTGGVY